MRRTIPLITLLAAALSLLAAPARADIVDTIVRDCQHSQTGYLTGTYTRAQLQKARDNLPSDVLEYTGCYDQIRQALRARHSGQEPVGGNGDGGTNGGTGSSGTGGGASDGTGTTGGGGVTSAGGGDGSAPALPATPHVGTNQAVELAGATVRPGALPAVGRDAHELPAPLIALLALLGVGALAPAVTTLTRRVIARRGA